MATRSVPQELSLVRNRGGRPELPIVVEAEPQMNFLAVADDAIAYLHRSARAHAQTARMHDSLASECNRRACALEAARSAAIRGSHDRNRCRVSA